MSENVQGGTGETPRKGWRRGLTWFGGLSRFLSSGTSLVGLSVVLFVGFGGLFYIDGKVKRNAERLHTLTVNSERIQNADRRMTAAVRLAASLESDRFLLNYQNTQDTKYALLDENRGLVENERIRKALDKLVDIQGEIEDVESEAIALVDEENWEDALDLVTDPAFQRQKGIYRAALFAALREMIQESQDQAKQANRLAAFMQYGVLGMFAFLALIGFLYSREMRRSLDRRSDLARSLEEVNVNLEKRVLDRTAELDESRALFKTVLDNMPAVVFLKTPEGRFELVNRQYEERYSVDQEAIRGKTLHDLYPKELADKLTGFDREVIEIGGHHEREHTVSKDGAEMVFFSVMFPVFGDDGEMTAFGGIELDITDRKKAERRLAESEERIRTIIENAADGIIAIGEQGIVQSFSPAAERIFGYAADEVVGSNVRILMPEPMRGEHDGFLKRYVSGCDARIVGTNREVVGLRRDGTKFPMDLAVGEAILGEERIFTGIVRDITDLKVKEAELARQKEIVDRTLGNLDQGIMMVDRDMCVVSRNARFGEMFSIPEAWFEPPANYHDIMGRWVEKQGFGQEVYDNMVADSLRREFFSVERPQADGGVVEMRHIPLDGGGFVRSFTDVTERKKAEEAIRLGGERLELALEGGNMGSWDVDLKASTTVVNSRWCEMLGHAVDEVDDPGPVWRETMHPDDRARVIEAGRAYRAGEAPSYEVEYRAVAKQGETRWMVSKGSIVGRDTDGSPLRMVGTVMDITERKEAERALAESEERTRLLLESVGEGVFGVDLQGRITFVNPPVLDMLGFEQEEMIGNGAHALFHYCRVDGSHYPVEECPMYRAFTFGESSRIDDEVLWRKDGTSFPVEYNATPIMREGEKMGAVISFADITERKQAERELAAKETEVRNSEAIFRSLTDHAPIAITLRDSKMKLLMVNATHAAWFGRSRDEMLSMRTKAFTPSDQIDMFAAAEKTVFESGQPAKPLEYRDEKPFREPLDLVAHKFPVRNADGEFIGIGTIQSDITERRKAEQEIADAMAQINASIEYASRIQRSILPPVEALSSAVSEHFVLWEPRDTVGGDMYWCRKWGSGVLILLGDCTGHGVPGAFMTLIANGALDLAYMEVPPGDAAALLQRMHQLIQLALGQDRGEGDSDDGLEAGACFLQRGRPTLTFAGARFSLFVSEVGEVREVKGDKSGLGYRGIARNVSFTNQTVDFVPDALYYMTSDGLIDQIGGEKSRSFGKRRFKELLTSIRDIPMDQQRDQVQQALSDWQGDQRRRDDVSILGFKGGST